MQEQGGLMVEICIREIEIIVEMDLFTIASLLKHSEQYCHCNVY